MPYLRTDEDGVQRQYTRMTEFTSTGECEVLAWNDKNLPFNRSRKGNIVTLPGTLTHHKIALDRLKSMTKPYKQLPLEIEAQEREYFTQLQKEHRRQKKLQKDDPTGRFALMSIEDKKTKLENMNDNIEQYYRFYEQFLQQHPHVVIYVEEKRFWKRKLLAGTIDLVATFKLKGVVAKVTIHDEIGEREYFFEDPQNPTANWYSVITLLDWKTSKAKQKGHAKQLSGYHFMWEDIGEFDFLRKQNGIINAQIYSVLLGKPSRYLKSHPDGQLYQFIKYDINSSFFLAYEKVRQSPRRLTVDENGKHGIKGRCIFCSEINNCPDNVVVPHNFREDEYIPMIPFSLRDISYMRLLLKNMNSTHAEYLKEKLTGMQKELELRMQTYQQKEIDTQIFEILKIKESDMVVLPVESN